jgi:hypothetical protein
MKQRCDNPNNTDYADYGGRGIVYCPAWKDFKNFSADMGRRPEGLSLERIDNAKGYSKDNCKWATQQEQCNNRRKRKLDFSALRGVRFIPERTCWDVRNNQRYIGRYHDFFEACCRRKSWEANEY